MYQFKYLSHQILQKQYVEMFSYNNVCIHKNRTDVLKIEWNNNH